MIRLRLAAVRCALRGAHRPRTTHAGPASIVQCRECLRVLMLDGHR